MPVRIGAINWDCSMPEDTYFGRYIRATLGPREFRNRTPYYARIIDEDHIDIRRRSQEEYDEELRWAALAGVDYFAYCWYPDEPYRHGEPFDGVVPEMRQEISSHVPELTYARKMYASSTLSGKIGEAAIIVTIHPYSRGDFVRLARETLKASYEKIDGRPLVYLFAYQPLPDRAAMIRLMREAFAQEGAGMPYIVAMAPQAPADADLSLVDAFSAYAVVGSGSAGHDLLTDEALGQAEYWRARGRQVIPAFPTGWNPEPRVDRPVPWTSYPARLYPEPASPEDLLRAAHRTAQWCAAHEEAWRPRHILSFAWNEFEEGGWICPTLRPDGSLDRSHLDAFAEAARLLRAELG